MRRVDHINVRRFIAAAIVGLVCATIAVLFVFIVQPASANMQEPSWLNSGIKASVTRKDPISGTGIGQRECTQREVQIFDGYEQSSDRACIYTVGDFRYGRIMVGAYAQGDVVVSFGFGGNSFFYRVQGVLDSTTELIPVSGTYSIIALKKNSHHDAFARIIRDFRGALVPVVQMGLVTGYAFDDSKWEYLLSEDGYDNWRRVPVNEVAVSKNGRWVVAQHYQRSVVLIDLQTGQQRIISDRPQEVISIYGLAVSDDGKYVAVSNIHGQYERQRIIIIETSSECGRVATPGDSYILNLESWHEGYEEGRRVLSCPDRIVTQDDLIEGNLEPGAPINTRLPYFDHNGQTINFWRMDRGYVLVTLTRGDYTGPRGMDYLALGDSYSSGEGDIEKAPNGFKYYRQGTNVDGTNNIPHEKCHISTRSYPYLLAQHMQLGSPLMNPNTQWQSVACSGALIRDSLWSDPSYMGQDSRLHGFGSFQQMQTTALNEFIPGRVKQIEFVKKYKPRVITLTMGGNDVGFGEKLFACATPFTATPTCKYATEEERSTLAGQITSQYSNLKSLYEELHEASDRQAKIYVLGYPQFISDAEMRSCSGIASLNYEERQMIYNSVTYLNSTIKAAAKAAGVYYVDIEDSLNSHRLCDDSEKYVTGVVGIPVSIKNEAQESFHPNSKGHAAIAQAVRNRLGQSSLLEYDVCPNGALICPDATSTKDTIRAPQYFKGVEPKNSQYKRMTNEPTIKGSLMRVISEPYILRPFSTANVTLHSDPMHLGDYVVGQDGSLDIEVIVPSIIPAGYHTLVVTGETFSGELMEYEQIVLVQGVNPNDIDENGIPDNQQSCGPFMIASGADQDQDGIDDACDPDVGTVPASHPQPTNPTPEPPVEKPTTKSIIKGIVKLAVTLIKLLFRI